MVATKAKRRPKRPRATVRERKALQAVRHIVRPTARLSISEWARMHVRITEGPLVGDSGEPVRWSPESFPPQVGIMDAIDDQRWSRVFIIGPPQASGKTQAAALPPLLHAIHHRRVSAAYVGANLNLATTQWAKKIKPAIEANGDLAQLIFENTDMGGTRVRRDFTNGTSLHCAGADSVGALSGFTAPVVVCDDVQGYPATLPGFGHPVDVAFARTESFPKEAVTLIGIGTAGTVDDYLWRAVKDSAYFVPLVPCLGCGVYQMLTWDRLIFDESSPAAAVASAWLECVNDDCSHEITFSELPAMLRGHRWVSVPAGEDWVNVEPDRYPENPRVYPYTDRSTDVAGFWLNALYWTLGKTWGDRAAEWLGRKGNPDRVKDHRQTVRVIPWQEPEEDERALTAEAIAAHQFKGHRYLTVPAAADLVTLTADVHDAFIYYIVRAWRKECGTSWLVDAGTLGVHGPKKEEKLGQREKAARVGHAIREALEDLHKMEAEGWVEADSDARINAAICLVDGGYRPDAVGQFCLARRQELGWRKWVMLKGDSDGDIWTGKATKNQRGHPFYRTNVSEGKHVLRELLAVPRDKPGAWHTYADRDLEAYHRHLISEHFITVRRAGKDKKIWEKRDEGGPNHWLDCEVYQIPTAIVCDIPLPVERFNRKKRPTRANRPALTRSDGRPFVATQRT